jgi:predicted transcriptional regulator
MTLLDTLNDLIKDQEGIFQCYEQDIRKESNQDPWYKEQSDRTNQRIEDLEAIKSELARLKRYDEELSSVMPKDYKDWWQNSPEEWPLVAKCSIESLREREELAWQHLERATMNEPTELIGDSQ